MDGCLMGVQLAAGKKTLTKTWMTHAGPTINNWTDVTTERWKELLKDGHWEE